VGNHAHPGYPQEVIVRETYIRETEYKMLDSVRPPPPEIVYVHHEEPERLGFLGFVGVVMLIIVLVIFGSVVSSIFSRARAQSNVQQFYGWGDYGANRNASPQVIIVPVPIQPRYIPFSETEPMTKERWERMYGPTGPGAVFKPN
jgi:hypothetical protein